MLLMPPELGWKLFQIRAYTLREVALLVITNSEFAI